jgi:hypothetical protein
LGGSALITVGLWRLYKACKHVHFHKMLARLPDGVQDKIGVCLVRRFPPLPACSTSADAADGLPCRRPCTRWSHSASSPQTACKSLGCTAGCR